MTKENQKKATESTMRDAVEEIKETLAVLQAEVDRLYGVHVPRGLYDSEMADVYYQLRRASRAIQELRTSNLRLWYATLYLFVITAGLVIAHVVRVRGL